MKNLLSRLTLLVDTLVRTVGTDQPVDPISNVNASTNIAKLSSEIKHLVDKCGDAENRLRRSNLIFSGIQDADNKAWAQSEEHVVSLCSKEFGIAVGSADIERARIAWAVSRQTQIAQSSSNSCVSRSNQPLLLHHPKKVVAFSIREDYSARVRFALKKLYEHALATKAAFKTRFDELLMDNKQ